MSGWKPIKTMPPGKAVLVWYPGFYGMQIASRMEIGRDARGLPIYQDSYWTDDRIQAVGGKRPLPTLWHPLPETPTETAQ